MSTLNQIHAEVVARIAACTTLSEVHDIVTELEKDLMEIGTPTDADEADNAEMLHSLLDFEARDAYLMFEYEETVAAHYAARMGEMGA
jgi:hypothetical protein